jgi:glycosyltransferase involved in cell wall biosynthesis
MIPKVSLIIAAFNMPRELPRTVRSLSPGMQHGVGACDYEIIVVDNGSTRRFDVDECRRWGADVRVLRIDPALASRSPVRALNAGIEQARGEVIGAMIDGARLASPGTVASALRAARIADRAVILTLGFHLGRKVQMQSVLEGYDAAEEDRVLEAVRWHEDGYRLFDVSVFAGSSRNGWFEPISESNALFMRRSLWEELGGFDERFESAGGGWVNLDTLARAVRLPDAVVVTLLGEGTFHQVHGGVATNAPDGTDLGFEAEYRRIRGDLYRRPEYHSLYLGRLTGVGGRAREPRLERVS